MVEWNNKRIILSVPACCDTDSIAGVCGDLLQDTVGRDGDVYKRQTSMCVRWKVLRLPMSSLMRLRNR